MDICSDRVYLSRHVTFDEQNFPFLSLTQPYPKPPPKLPSHFTTKPFPVQTQLEIESGSQSSSDPISSTTSSPTPSDSHIPSATPSSPQHLSDSSICSSPSPIISEPPPFIPVPPTLSTNTIPNRTHPMVTRAQDGTRKPKVFLSHRYPIPTCLTVIPIPKEPTHFSQAKLIPEWQLAMQDEYNALLKNNTRTLVPRMPT